jgi:DNA-binding CsgD family transcriptional regulator
MPSFATPLNAPAEAAIGALQLFDDPEQALEAERLFIKAARRCNGLILREELRCLWAAGEASRRAGALAQARKRLLEVEKRAKAHGLAPLLGRIHCSLRRTGIRRASLRAASSHGLTAREREVLALVGSGGTSAEIARRLGLTVGTVDSEVRSAMTKLNASTRIQAALLSAREPATRSEDESPPLIVVEPGSGARAEAVRELEGSGWRVDEGWDGTKLNASGLPEHVVFTGVVSGPDDATDALVAAARGAGLIVELGAGRKVTEPFLEDLRHLGPIYRREASPERCPGLSAEQTRLLTLVAEGRSVAEAATLLHVSRRTAERRLAGARATLGVRTTAEAVGVAGAAGGLLLRG